MRTQHIVAPFRLNVCQIVPFEKFPVVVPAIEVQHKSGVVVLSVNQFGIGVVKGIIELRIVKMQPSSIQEIQIRCSGRYGKGCFSVHGKPERTL